MNSSERLGGDENLQKIDENSDEDNDEEITLSEIALKALQEFYQEKELRNMYLERTGEFVDLVEENWELSQFWYDQNTSIILRDVALKIAGDLGRIACISCPTVYAYLFNHNSEQTKDIYLFEYDKRFKDLYEDHCIFYNYNEPLVLPQNFKSFFDIVLVDPPYLSKECLEKTAETVKFIAKDKIILCTGAIMEELVVELLGLKTCAFQPQHEKKLGNEFRCYSNFDVDYMIQEIKQNNC